MALLQIFYFSTCGPTGGDLILTRLHNDYHLDKPLDMNSTWCNIKVWCYLCTAKLVSDFLSWAIQKIPFTTHCSWTENPLSDISSSSGSSQSSTPGLSVKSLSLIEPGKTSLNKSSIPWGEILIDALPVAVLCNLKT